MVPAAVVDQTIADLLTHLAPRDFLIDGGNSYYVDDIQRATNLAAKEFFRSTSAQAAASGVWNVVIA
jgi:6-phosphogluconate dehydrogenase (decarboxylating)